MQCIMPPHILEHLLKSEDADLREIALTNLLTNGRLGGERIQDTPPPPVSSPGTGRDVQGYVITIEEANQSFATLSRWILNHSSAEGGSC
jgi:hypothetical protein